MHQTRLIPHKPQCPECGSEKLFGPAWIILVDESDEPCHFPYYDCARCHFNFRIPDDRR